MVADKQFLKRTHYVLLMPCWNTCIWMEKTAKTGTSARVEPADLTYCSGNSQKLGV